MWTSKWPRILPPAGDDGGQLPLSSGRPNDDRKDPAVDYPTIRRLLFATVLLLQPPLQLAEQATDPQVGASGHAADARTQVAAIAAHPDQRLLSILLGIAALALFVPVVLGLRHLLRARAPMFAHTGAAMALTGVVTFAALHGADLARLAVARTPGLSLDQAATSVGNVDAEGPLTLIFLVGMMVGTLLLAIGLWRTGVVPRAASVLIIGFLVVDFASVPVGSRPLTLVAHVLLWAGTTIVAATVVRAPATSSPAPAFAH